MERFMSRKLNRNIKTAGVRAIRVAQGAAALVGIELEDVPEQEHQKDHQEQEHHDRETGKNERLAGCDGIQDADIKCLQGAQQGEEQKHSETEQEHGSLPRIAE
jgi:hypothetical protein